ncbi:hypothetical protein NKI32_03805 [Mesorhizobium sp. M0761]|uniref:hypothetical protein n=1 Tax=Mesorhizobium sp. M0761 TaxID=2956994 RepID=UPI00333AA893
MSDQPHDDKGDMESYVAEKPVDPLKKVTTIDSVNIAQNGQFVGDWILRKDFDPVAEAEKGQQAWDLIQDGMEIQNQSWLQNQYEIFLKMENNRAEHYQRFINHPFFHLYRKKRPKLDDEPLDVMRHVLRFGFQAFETRSGLYRAARRYATLLCAHYNDGRPADEVAARLNKKSRKYRLLTLMEPKKPRKEDRSVSSEVPATLRMPKPERTKHSKPTVRVLFKSETLVERIKALPVGGCFIVAVERRKGKFIARSTQLFPEAAADNT